MIMKVNGFKCSLFILLHDLETTTPFLCSMWNNSLTFWPLTASSKFALWCIFTHTYFVFILVLLKLVFPKISLNNPFLSGDRGLFKQAWDIKEILIFIFQMWPLKHILGTTKFAKAMLLSGNESKHLHRNVLEFFSVMWRKCSTISVATTTDSMEISK